MEKVWFAERLSKIRFALLRLDGLIFSEAKFFASVIAGWLAVSISLSLWTLSLAARVDEQEIDRESKKGLYLLFFPFLSQRFPPGRRVE